VAPPRPIVLSCGEPAGIGAEIALKARAALPDLPVLWIGEPAHLPPGSWAAVADPGEAAAVPPRLLPVLAHPIPGPAVPGRPDPAQAPAVIGAIARAVALVQAGAAAALCTLPVSKQALRAGAAFGFAGHTDYLAALAGVGRAVMMLAGAGLRVVPVTGHIPLAAVPAALTAAAIEETLRITDAALRRDFGIAAPRIAVAGLNPHAGEGGTLGAEEARLIAPVLERLRATGMAVIGPRPADTMFHPAARAGYDAAVCMYHDQALIPVKTIDFAGAVNVTLGLPFVRTSPDHGTAFDIAGRGIADPASLIAALRLARDLAQARAAAAGSLAPADRAAFDRRGVFGAR
jgi:4-hydroxythreonine-4-phosphate dehydrogenase